MNKEFLEGYCKIVDEMQVPKSKHNKFGDFKYRSAEDIFNEYKKVRKKLGLNYALLCTDEVVVKGARYYVKATAILTDGTDTISTEAEAREAEEKKPMDCAQITGGASSYARKYALNGLFNLDDSTDDPDDPSVKERQLSTDNWREDVPKLKTVGEITKYWDNHVMFQTDDEFKSACTKRKMELLNANKK